MCHAETKDPKKPSAGGGGLSPAAIGCDLDKGDSVKGGKVAYKDDQVAVRTGTTYTQDGTESGYKDGISIHNKCKKNPHLVQFVYREIIGADGKHVARKFRSTTGYYDLTTDPANPVWNTDSSASPSPYYELPIAESPVNLSPDGLMTFDQPGLSPAAGETWKATFKAYTICDGKVTKEVTWVRSQKFGEDPKYDVSVKDCSALPDWANKKLKDQGFNGAP
jgi:hypothetical protein